MTSDAFSFDPTIVAAVLHHMNDDHADDNLLIARAFGDRDATAARMVGVDGRAGYWVYSVGGADGEAAPDGAMLVGGDPSADVGDPADADEIDLRVEWSGAITERPEIRREIVVLYDRACAELGIAARDHD